ncbi:MAG: hypothetical protein JKY48_18465 [Flavobacteriales bacterium]|nr:hypothetical protein [Flavobacteriales bacterium]
MRTKLFSVVFGSIILCSCATQHKQEIKKAEWLIGTWENKTDQGSVYETWTKVNNNEFSGKSYVVNENDTIVFETIQLIQEQDDLFYIPKVEEQNEGLPIRFALNTISDSVFVFKNTQHDFPKIISYSKINADSLVAEISGTQDGQELKQTFPMKRIE